MKIKRVDLGSIIKKIVEEKGLTNADFARQIGLQRQNVVKSVFENNSLDTNLLCNISEVLDCNLFDYYQFQSGNEKRELKATLTVEMGSEKKDKTFRFVFGENNVELKTK